MDEERRNRIIAAFRRHFEHRGFKKTAVDEVASELKLSKKTIYQFFSSKEEVYFAIVKEAAVFYARTMAKDIERLPGSKDKIVLLVEKIFLETARWIRKNDAFEFKYKFEIASLAFQEAYQDLFRTLIAKAMEDGELPRSNVDLKIAFIQGILQESMRLYNAKPDATIAEETGKSIVKILE